MRRSTLLLLALGLATGACRDLPTETAQVFIPEAASATVATLAVADAEIIYPGADEVVYENQITLLGRDLSAVDNTARWAVREGTCAAGTNTVAGNVDGYSNAFTWGGGEFSADVNLIGLEGGMYCFVLNTQQGPAEGHRLTQEFYLVDEYVIAGGTLQYDPDPDPEFDPPGKSYTHALDGVIGNAGARGTVGFLHVNYRELNENCTFTPGSLSLSSAAGVGVTADLKGNIRGADGSCPGGSTDNASIYVLDRDGNADLFPRGAIVLRWDGGPTQNDYEIDGSVGRTGADSWVPFVRGNAHVGKRPRI